MLRRFLLTHSDRLSATASLVVPESFLDGVGMAVSFGTSSAFGVLLDELYLFVLLMVIVGLYKTEYEV